MQDFGTKSDNTAGPSGQLSADEFNNLATELENSVLRSGLILSGSSSNQLAESLFIHSVKAKTFQDSGAANAYVATPMSGSSGVLLPSDYANLNGFVIIFKASNANTGASTLNIGQTTGTLLGAKAIVDQAGAAIPASAIAPNAYIQLRYDASIGSGSWVLLPWSMPATQSSAGLIELADTAESQAWSDPFRALTPGGLNLAFQGSNQSLSASGYQKYPGGLIEQWGLTTTSAAGATPVTLPIAFPSQFLGVVTGVSASTNAYSATIHTPTLTDFQLNGWISNTAARVATPVFWRVWGK